MESNTVISKKMLREIKEKTLIMYARWEKKGGKLSKYGCNFCEKFIPTNVPTPDQTGEKGYWDSSTICLECGSMNFVLTFPNGNTISKDFDSDREIRFIVSKH